MSDKEKILKIFKQSLSFSRPDTFQNEFVWYRVAEVLERESSY